GSDAWGGNRAERSSGSQASPRGRDVDACVPRERDAAVEAPVEISEARHAAIVEQVLDLGESEPAELADQHADPLGELRIRNDRARTRRHTGAVWPRAIAALLHFGDDLPVAIDDDDDRAELTCDALLQQRLGAVAAKLGDERSGLRGAVEWLGL